MAGFRFYSMTQGCRNGHTDTLGFPLNRVTVWQIPHAKLFLHNRNNKNHTDVCHSDGLQKQMNMYRADR